MPTEANFYWKQLKISFFSNFMVLITFTKIKKGWGMIQLKVHHLVSSLPIHLHQYWIQPFRTHPALVLPSFMPHGGGDTYSNHQYQQFTYQSPLVRFTAARLTRLDFQELCVICSLRPHSGTLIQEWWLQESPSGLSAKSFTYHLLPTTFVNNPYINWCWWGLPITLFLIYIFQKFFNKRNCVFSECF